MKEIRLFCFPFAGGNKFSYREMEQVAPPFLKLIPLEYPGRGARMREAFITDMDELVDDLYEEAKKHMHHGDYAFYGHSMGGLVAFFVVKKIIAEGLKAPLHLFITGTTGPSAFTHHKKRHLLNKKDFIQEIRDLDGCPEEILQDEELLQYFEPILRADFQVSETYTYHAGPPLDLPFTVITGTQEDMTREDIQAWQKETIRPIVFRTMPGKHFFILNYAFEIMKLFSHELIFYNKYINHE